jgi:hypothetical protein
MLTLLLNILGWSGTALLLLAYFLVSSRRIEGDSVAYQVMNILGAAMLITNSAYFGAYPSVGVNVAWIFIALFTLATIRRKRSKQGALGE